MIEFGNIAHGRAIAEEAGCSFNPAVDPVISRSERGRLLGGVIFQNFTGHSIGIHVAGFHPLWINRDMLWVTFDYPFNQLACKYLFGQVRASNSNTIAFDKKIGFKEVARVPDVFPGEDLIVMKMSREECRWIKLKPRNFVTREVA